ncbi:MAG: hypothetical protein Q8R60_07480 [Mycobacteriales bacterium]|nr:hypothetical protein [Mycobacteriales bacterium]
MTVSVALVVAENSELIGLVRALAALERQDLPEHALIGGVAVMTRLAQAHRVTLDVDQVLRETVPSTVDSLVARRAAQRVGAHVELPGGVRLDVISTLEQPLEEADLPDDDADRLFLLAHEWALVSAERVELSVHVAGATRPAALAALPVATAPALFVAKLQAATRRPQATLAKRGTDVDDARRLLESVGSAAVARGIADAPDGLTALTARLVDRLLVQDSERSVLWIKQAGAPGGGAVSPDELRDLGLRLHRALTGS